MHICKTISRQFISYDPLTLETKIKWKNVGKAAFITMMAILTITGVCCLLAGIIGMAANHSSWVEILPHFLQVIGNQFNSSWALTTTILGASGSCIGMGALGLSIIIFFPEKARRYLPQMNEEGRTVYQIKTTEEAKSGYALSRAFTPFNATVPGTYCICKNASSKNLNISYTIRGTNISQAIPPQQYWITVSGPREELRFWFLDQVSGPFRNIEEVHDHIHNNLQNYIECNQDF